MIRGIRFLESNDPKNLVSTATNKQGTLRERHERNTCLQQDSPSTYITQELILLDRLEYNDKAREAVTGGVDDGDLIGFNLSKLDPQSWTQRTQVRPISVVISPCLLWNF